METHGFSQCVYHNNVRDVTHQQAVDPGRGAHHRSRFEHGRPEATGHDAGSVHDEHAPVALFRLQGEGHHYLLVEIEIYFNESVRVA